MKNNDSKMMVPMHKDYFVSLPENLTLESSPSVYNEGLKNDIMEFESPRSYIIRDAEEVSKAYDVDTEIGSIARELSFDTFFRKFNIMISNSSLSLAQSIEETINYYLSITIDKSFAASIGAKFIEKSIDYSCAIFAVIVDAIKNDISNIEYAFKINLYVDKLIGDIYDIANCDIIKLCLKISLSDVDKTKILNAINPIFVIYRDSLIDSIYRFICEISSMDSFCEYVSKFPNRQIDKNE